MVLRDHPKLAPWPPGPSGCACVGPTPSAREMGDLILRNVLIKTPARVELVLDYKGGNCIFIKDCDDGAFATSLYEKLTNCRGWSLHEIGNLEVDF